MSGAIPPKRRLLSARTGTSSNDVVPSHALGVVLSIVGLVFGIGCPPVFFVWAVVSLFISVQALAARRKYALGIGAQGLSYGPDSPAGPPATSGSERWAPDDIDALRVTFLSGTVAEVAFRTRDGVTRCWVARVPDTLDFLNDISAFANAATLGERWRPRAWPLFILSLIGFPISPALMGLVFAPLITAVPEAWNELAVTLLLFSLLCRAATAPAMRTALTIRAFSRAPSGTDASRASVITTGRDDASRG